MNHFDVLFGSDTASFVYLLKREVADSSVFSISNFNIFTGHVSVPVAYMRLSTFISTFSRPVWWGFVVFDFRV